jgi:hypothetical protein
MFIHGNSYFISSGDYPHAVGEEFLQTIDSLDKTSLSGEFPPGPIAQR